MHFLITNLFSAASWKLPVDPSSPQVRFLGPHGIMQEPHHFAELLAQPELGVWDEQFGRPASRFPCGIRFLLSPWQKHAQMLPCQYEEGNYQPLNATFPISDRAAELRLT